MRHGRAGSQQYLQESEPTHLLRMKSSAMVSAAVCSSRGASSPSPSRHSARLRQGRVGGRAGGHMGGWVGGEAAGGALQGIFSGPPCLAVPLCNAFCPAPTWSYIRCRFYPPAAGRRQLLRQPRRGAAAARLAARLRGLAAALASSSRSSGAGVPLPEAARRSRQRGGAARAERRVCQPAVRQAGLERCRQQRLQRVVGQGHRHGVLQQVCGWWG